MNFYYTIRKKVVILTVIHKKVTVMKTILTTLLLFIFCIALQAQANPVYLQINPTISKAPLAMIKGQYSTPNGVKYKLKRLQYYISGVTIFHDGNQETKCDQVYLLINPDQTDYYLGDYNINNVERIVFNIGVDSVPNHGDPTAWPAGHALAPQNPSMHWGWAAGYRFAAIEGNSDSGNGQFADLFEFHTIGDELLTKVEVNASSEDNAGKKLITLYADYNKLFTNIDLFGGKIQHGNLTPNDILMANFKDVYYTSPSVATKDVNSHLIGVNVVSPASGLHINYTSDIKGMNFRLMNTNGQALVQQNNISASGSISSDIELPAGVYIYNFYTENTSIATGKIIITK